MRIYRSRLMLNSPNRALLLTVKKPVFGDKDVDIILAGRAVQGDEMELASGGTGVSSMENNNLHTSAVKLQHMRTLRSNKDHVSKRLKLAHETVVPRVHNGSDSDDKFVIKTEQTSDSEVKRNAKPSIPTGTSIIKQELSIIKQELPMDPFGPLDNTTVKLEEATVKLEEATASVLGPIESKVKIEIETTSSDVKLEPVSNNVEIESAANIFPLVSEKDKSVGPNNWWAIYNEIAYMRTKFTSPVDTQGCERMPNTIYPGVRVRYPKIYRFQLLISLMLSSQTKDEVNFDAMVKLQSYFLEKGYKHGLCLQAILDSSETLIDELICKVGFHNKKAVYIKKTCEMIRSNFKGDIPKTVEEIVTFPGVGPKMAYLLLQNAWNINTGIGVDVHVHRLAQMWGWTTKAAKNPEQTRLQLQQWLPEKYWQQINPLLVGFGQVICVPKASNCDICSLATKKLCPGVNRKLINGPISDSRLEKLQKQRGDLSKLIEELQR